MKLIHLASGMAVLLCACVPLTMTQDMPSGRDWCSRLPGPSTSSPLEYAEDKRWYREDEPVRVFGGRYFRWGFSHTSENLSRADPPPRFRYAGEYDGVPMYVQEDESDQISKPDVFYLLLNSKCDLQPFNIPHALTG